MFLVKILVWVLDLPLLSDKQEFGFSWPLANRGKSCRVLGLVKIGLLVALGLVLVILLDRYTSVLEFDRTCFDASEKKAQKELADLRRMIEVNFIP